MNILVVTQLYPEPDDIGGYKITHTVEYFCKEWLKMGHNVFVFHCPSKFPFFYYLIPNNIKNKFVRSTYSIIPSLKSRKELDYTSFGINVRRLPILKLYPGSNYSKRKIKAVSQKIVKELLNKSFIPDIVMGHFANPSTEIVANISQYFNCYSSIVFHNDCDEKNIKKYRLNQSISRINAIGCRSAIESKKIQELFRLQVEPFVCYSGVPNDAIYSADLKCTKHKAKKPISYLYVGGLVKNKNVDCVIKAFASCRNKNDKLGIIGAGMEEEPLRQLVCELHIEDSVRFFGRLSRNDVLTKMKESNLFVMVSEKETFGMVYMEAMLQGCIVVASKGGGFDGIIKEGENGYLSNPGDLEMLKKVLIRINNLSTDERNMIGQAAIDTARKYSEKEVAIKYLNDALERNRSV